MFHKAETRSVESWREFLDENSGKWGSWKIMTREMFNSRAFRDLSRSGMIVVLAMLDKLSFHSKKVKDRKGVQYGGQALKNEGAFYLTGNELKARGLKSDRSIADGKVQPGNSDSSM